MLATLATPNPLRSNKKRSISVLGRNTRWALQYYKGQTTKPWIEFDQQHSMPRCLGICAFRSVPGTNFCIQKALFSTHTRCREPRDSASLAYPFWL
jgi:hypothetical protein